MNSRFYIYILYSSSYNKYYVGYTAEPWRRLNEHNTVPHNTFTSKYRPWVIAALFLCGENVNDAVRIERWIKQQKSRRLIEKLIDTDFQPEGVCAQLVRVPHLRD
ncbi:GIY-YIG nuclease family protein [Hydrotalea sp.]|uniref:GIY-YIG nuclease family protein n=1 Tax=Hydrotalea sp. TaxID=2881279 RepID=UPI00342985F5